MTAQRRWLVVNETSGSHQEEMIGDLREILGQQAADDVHVIDVKHDGMPKRAELEREGVDVLVVHGGDGSLNYAASELEGWSGALLPLPGGTANLLCHRLFEECDSTDIARRFVAGEFERRRLPCVRGENVLALSEILAGPGAKWADVREELRESALLEAASDAAEAISESWSGPKVALREPSLGKEDGYAGVRLSPVGDAIKIQGYAAGTVGDFLGQGLAILKHDFREGPHDDLGAVSSVTCVGEDGAPIPLMVDGERYDGRNEERFSLAPLDLDLFCPRA